MYVSALMYISLYTFLRFEVFNVTLRIFGIRSTLAFLGAH